MNKNRLFQTALILAGTLIVVLILVAFIGTMIGRKTREQAKTPSSDEAQIQTSEQIRKQLKELDQLRSTLNPNPEAVTEKAITAQLEELEVLRMNTQKTVTPTSSSEKDIQTQLEELEGLRNQL